ncbi:uncharacterized protein E0L32_010695 [Thyridium curvatum]|uniref:Uncharacterized protein n=1 Tax=Thyridium curvatum TaxID=1093900 RepID=A0A507AM48_9PEZI|nr:uncharacterized protein E0L32_010695 [Thyridium curvatum]TPX07596.1 hypothetical protein E0L32_010695 [Thyridium curvatum]
MSSNSLTKSLIDAHDNLERMYRLHGEFIENKWRSFDRNQRARCCYQLFKRFDHRRGVDYRSLMRMAADFRLASGITDQARNQALIPELNPVNLVNSDPESLVDLLRHRASGTLISLYDSGLDGSPGDRQFVVEMTMPAGKTLSDYQGTTYAAIGLDDEVYARPFTRKAGTAEAIGYLPSISNKDLGRALRDGSILPQSMGLLVVTRQFLLANLSYSLMVAIFEASSEAGTKFDAARLGDQALAIMKNLDSMPRPTRIDLSDLQSFAQFRTQSLRDMWLFMVKEPAVLLVKVGDYRSTTAARVPDYTGFAHSTFSQSYSSRSFVEALHDGLSTIAIWDYMDRLLQQCLSAPENKAYQTILRHELSRVSSMAVSRAQAFFVRLFRIFAGTGHFQRSQASLDKLGDYRVVMTTHPDVLTIRNPQMHLLLRLCRSETDTREVARLVPRLVRRQRIHPDEREILTVAEAEAFAQLKVTAEFAADLSTLLYLPPPKPKAQGPFAGRLEDLDMDISKWKEEIDLLDCFAPLNNLLEPGVALAAFKTIDSFMLDKAGTTMGYLYEDLVQDALEDLQGRYDKEMRASNRDQAQSLLQFSEWRSQPLEERVKLRREKQKTRPVELSLYDLAAAHGDDEDPAGDNREDESVREQAFQVTASTKEVFENLFPKGQQARGSVSWTAFQAAMVELGFTVTPKYGSAVTFEPTEAMSLAKSVTVHRPHQAKIEGHKLLMFASRLRTVYGWDEGTFELA